MVESRNGLNMLKATLKAYPLIWFDNNSMALFLEIDRKTVSRNREKIKTEMKKGIATVDIEERGRYFRILLD